jgi:hypothetical protein
MVVYSGGYFANSDTISTIMSLDGDRSALLVRPYDKDVLFEFENSSIIVIQDGNFAGSITSFECASSLFLTQMNGEGLVRLGHIVLDYPDVDLSFILMSFHSD